jgi:hypothetical protein
MEPRTYSTRPRLRRRGGFSLAEGLVASAILAIAVVGIAGPLGAAHEHANILQERSAAIVLARQLLGEIAAKPLLDGGTTCHLGPEAGETDHTKYDSADDYNGYADSTATMRDLSGNLVGFDTANPYNRAVTVQYRTTIGGAATTSGDFALVTVTITTPHKQLVSVSRLLTRQTQAN